MRPSATSRTRTMVAAARTRGRTRPFRLVPPRPAPGVHAYAPLRDVADEDDARCRATEGTHPVLVLSSSLPGRRQRGQAGVARRRFDPRTVVPLVDCLETQAAN